VPEDLPLPPSTVHRLLARHGLMDKPAGEAGDQDRRRFAFANAGELWMSDVMHGPSVVVGERVKRKTYLIAFIDDATRVIPHAAFALAENTRSFLPVLKLAIEKRGLPQRLYVDNGANYRSRHLALVCAKLGIALIHARPYRPQGKGKIERWFKTVRAQLLTRLSAEDTASLQALNRRLAVWLEGEYHHSPHRGLDGATPLEQWAQTGAGVRFPEPGLELADVFLFEAERKVQKDRTVSLNGVVYEVDAALVGETVTLRFDPGAPPERPVQVCHAGKLIELAAPVQTYANCFVKRDRPSWTLSADGPAPQPAPSALRLRELPDQALDTGSEPAEER
jgi:transposase InsO family protein